MIPVFLGGRLSPKVALPLIVLVAVALGALLAVAGASTWYWLEGTVAALGWGLALFLAYIRLSPRGIQWFNRVLSSLRRTHVEARLTATFEPDEIPQLAALLEIVKRWCADDRRFSVLISESDDSGALKVLDLHTGKLGRIVLTCDEPIPDNRYIEEGPLCYLALPDHPYELGHLVKLIKTDIAALLEAVGDEMGQPTGLNLEVAIDPQSNPFYGLYIRDDVARTGVTSFGLRLEPIGTSARVEIDTDAVVIRSQSGREFVQVASSFLGFRP